MKLAGNGASGTLLTPVPSKVSNDKDSPEESVRTKILSGTSRVASGPGVFGRQKSVKRHGPPFKVRICMMGCSLGVPSSFV